MRSMARVIAIACCLALPVTSCIAPVTHHGMRVDADLPAEICVTCHDGAAKHTSHPIFNDYPPPGKETEYASAAEVQAKGIRLVRGQVVCISCHDLRKPGPQHLVISSEKDELCFCCHIKMGR